MAGQKVAVYRLTCIGHSKDQMQKYRKVIPENSFEHYFYQSLGFPPVTEDSDLVIRITVEDMDLIDGFYSNIPLFALNLSIKDTIQKFVISGGVDSIKEQSLSLNPDLYEVRSFLISLYELERTGRISLVYNINNGESDINAEDFVHKHIKTFNSYRLLDIVLDIDPRILPEEEKRLRVKEYRKIFVLYQMDRYGIKFRKDQVNPELNETLEQMVKCGYVEWLMDNEGLPYAGITDRGYELINAIVDEAESYIENYDIFGDVQLNGDGNVKFYTGYGNDLIVPVLIEEGLDPCRVLFLSALYLGNLDGLLSDSEMLFTIDILNKLLNIIVMAPTREELGNELLKRIIASGKDKLLEKYLKVERMRIFKAIDDCIEKI